MKDQSYKEKQSKRASALKRYAISLCVLLAAIWLSALTTSAQNSTDSILTNDETVITIRGKRFVLVPEQTFSKIEKMTDEVPALRDENVALKAKGANDDKIIAKDAEIIKLKDQVIERTEAALKAQTERAEALTAANEANKKALEVSETDRARLQKQVKKYRRYAVIGGIVSAALIFLRR